MKIVKRDNVVQAHFSLTPKVPDQVTNLIIQESGPKILSTNSREDVDMTTYFYPNGKAKSVVFPSTDTPT